MKLEVFGPEQLASMEGREEADCEGRMWFSIFRFKMPIRGVK